jgi:lysozyme
LAAYTIAADYMLQSKWAKQTPNRANRHAEQMRTGVWQ